MQVALEEVLDVNLIEHNLDHLVERDIKIVVAFVGERDAVDLLCKASQAGLTTSEYAWILPSYTNPDWWRRSSNCTQKELISALESTLFLLPTKYPPFTQTNMVRSYSTELIIHQHIIRHVIPVVCTPLQTYNAEEFKEALFNQTGLAFGNSRFLLLSNAISAYDGVWTIAKAWKAVRSCENSINSTVTKELERALDEISVSINYRLLYGVASLYHHSHTSQAWLDPSLSLHIRANSNCAHCNYTRTHKITRVERERSSHARLPKHSRFFCHCI